MATPKMVHRIGGASVENLRLKPREATLPIPGISVISAATPFEAAEEMRTGLPGAKQLHRLCETVASADEEAIRRVGFDLMPMPSDALPNHYRIIHPDGAAGFTDENLLRLSSELTTTEGADMTNQNIRFLDSSRKQIATASVADCGDHFGGTIDLKQMPENLRALFDEFEEIVNGQMFAFLDEVQAKIGSHRITAQFEDGFELPVKDLQVFPSQGELSFQLAGVPATV